MIISISGHDGSGKTTFSSKLKDRLSQKMKVKKIHLVNANKSKIQYLKKDIELFDNITGRNKAIMYTILKLYNYLNVDFKNNDIIIFDRYKKDDLVILPTFIDDLSFYKFYQDKLLNANLEILVDCPLEIMQKRLEERNKKTEKESYEYQKKNQHLYKYEAYDFIIDGTNVSDSIEEVATYIEKMREEKC